MIENRMVVDSEWHDSENELENQPVCYECGEHIQDESHYIYDGMHICNRCMDNHRVSTDNFLEDF